MKYSDSSILFANLKRDRRTTSQSGFTLIEVLVGLIIIAIALTALIQASIYYRNTVGHLKQKSVAQWVASDIYHQYFLGIYSMPLTLTTQNGEVDQLNQHWYWNADFASVSGMPITKITIRVKNNPSGSSIACVTGFLNSDSNSS